MNQKFYMEKNEPNRSCLLALRDIILNQDADISETTKYGMPCFLFKKRMFCYLWEDKKTQEPYLLVVEGNRLSHPRLEQGSRARMKIFRVNPTEDLPMTDIQNVLNSALDLYRNGTINPR